MIIALWEVQARGLQVEPGLGHSATPYLKKRKRKKRVGEQINVKTQGSIANTTKRKNKKEGGMGEEEQRGEEEGTL